MCGIAGIFTPERATTGADVAAVRRMMGAQIHRGPDGEGLHQDSHAVLGHRRLSIIDLSDAGRQPMANEGRTVWVTYNGEIYNFVCLREELIRAGHDFHSRTDTEVLVHGYEEWGIEGLLSRLRGMFAFALYDLRAAKPRLVLAKDRFGIKPLYYSYQAGAQIVFASEVRAILESGLVRDERNEEALVRFLQLGSVPIPLTTVKDIQALPAAQYAILSEDGLQLKQYWDLSRLFDRSPDLPAPTSDETLQATSDLLSEAVNLHLISDVPLGLFLSGGLDSSALVALASRFRETPVTTLSIIFEEQNYDESPYSKIVAHRYGTNHHEVLIGKKDFMDGLPRIFAAMDQPTVDGVNTFLVSKAAKETGLRVVLSGLGGDEVFLGYSHFRMARSLETAWRLYGALPPGWRKACVSLATQAGVLAGKPRIEKLSYLEDGSHESMYLLFRALFSPEQIGDLLGTREAEASSRSFSFGSAIGSGSGSLVGALNGLEFQHYLQNQLLKDTDAMSMAHSIETRVPYLDHKLVEHVVSLPTRLKLHGQVNKPMLVSAVGNGLPREVWERRKMGFTFPFDDWLKDSSAELQAYTLERKVLDPKATNGIWRQFREGRLHWSRPWALVVASHTAAWKN